MKKNLLPILALVIVGAVLGYILLTGSNENNNTRLTVAATIFPLADIVENVAGDEVEVVNILPPGASPHTFEVTPSTIKDIQGSKIVFAIGGGLDAWTADLVSASTAEIFTVDEGVAKQSFVFEHHHDEHDHEEEAEEHGHEEDEHEEAEHEPEAGEPDPHYWLSTNSAKIVAENVAAKLIEIDPENSELYQNNLIAYQAELDQTYDEITALLADLSSRELIVFHESWNYFADEFDLEIVGVFTASPGKEPSPSELAELHDTAIEHEITAIFSEPQLSPETIRPFVEDLDLELYVMDPLGGIDERDSLINTLKYNAQTIKEALRN